MPSQKPLDLTVAVAGGVRLVGDGRSESSRPGLVLHIREELTALSLFVEVVTGARINHDGGIGAASLHRVDHLDAFRRGRPIVRPADEHQEWTNDQLVDEGRAPPGIHADARGKPDRRQLDASALRPLEARSVDDRHREDAALRPADGRNAIVEDIRLGLEVAQRADRVVEARGNRWLVRTGPAITLHLA